MNNLYAKYSITSRGEPQSEAEWYYVEPQMALERGDIYVGIASISIPSEATVHLVMNTGLTKDVYLIGLDIAGTANRLTETIEEAPVYTAVSNPLTMVNLNRQKSSKAPEFAVYTSVTGYSNGLIIDRTEKYEAKKSPQSIASQSNLRYLFKRDTTYGLTIVNGDNQQTLLNAKFWIMER